MSRRTTLSTLIRCCVSPVSGADRPDYERDVKPILRKHCWSCHAGLKQEGGLRLDTGALAVSGGDSGAAVVPDDANASLLIERIQSDDESLRMPQEAERLAQSQIQTLIRWIKSGAKSPADEKPQRDPRRHWAFQTPVRPDVPVVGWQSELPGEGIRNPIDAFIAARHKASGLTPSAATSPTALLRRATLDVTGLPPTSAEVRAFEADHSDSAWQQVVERLLDDDAYGERWGRHWMDVWRYSDWYGRRRVNDVRNSYPHIWRWRDWIINSLNKDTGYDQMVRMMLAADELDPENDENIVALGFIVRNWFSLNHDTWMQDLVEHTGKAFLGLRLNCAHCHDHKYDPITQEEYFRFRAFFEPLELRHDRVPGGPALTKYIRYKPGSGSSLKPIAAGLARVYDDNHEAETFMYRLGDARDRFDRPPVQPGTPAILQGESLAIETIDLPGPAWLPSLKGFVARDELATHDKAIEDAQAKLVAAEAELQKNEADLVAAVKEADATLADRRQELAGSQPLSRAISGEQSLVMEGRTGRSCIANQLTTVTTIDDDTLLTYRVRLETDTHTAVGLTLDMQTGRTGGYVAFKAGQIMSYRAGGRHAVFYPGRYSFADGQSTFAVTLDLQPSKDQFLLTVVTRPGTDDEKVLVDGVPCALHGWNHARNAAHVLALDARAGSKAVYDDVRLGPSDGQPLLLSNFEHPRFTHGSAIAGIDGWTMSKWRVAPGAAFASRLTETSPELEQAELANLVAHKALEAVRLGVTAAQQRLTAEMKQRNAVQARLDANRRRYLEGLASELVPELVRTTVQTERQAQLASAEAAHVAAQLELAQAEARALDDEKRSGAVQAASKKFGQAAKDVAAKKAALDQPVAEYTSFGPSYSKTSTGRRRALAEWLTHPDNPLPARVAVNQIWMRHFGRPVVESVNDFGNSGAEPTHPELLDWLAVEFIESGWSMKHVHRLILTSQTYRLSSVANDSSRIDPQNRFVCRFTPRRLEAEAIRDSMLAVSGRLDRTLGGQEIDPQQESKSLRRSLYFGVYPEAGGVMPFLKQFDAANPCDCYRRTDSIVPQQALAMNNSELAQNESRHTADRLLNEFKDVTEDRPGRLVDAAFLACLSRGCKEQERRLAVDFLGRQLALYGQSADAERRAVASLVRALFSHTEFVTLR